MMRSMLLAIAALRNHQTYMDVVASNISNVNTTAYKSSRVSFQELFSETLRGASAPSDTLGGLNPVQLGLGVELGGVDTLYTQGSLEETGKETDLAVSGDGFFVLRNGDGYVYTRDGNMTVGLDGSLQSATTGMRLMGWAVGPDGTVDTTGALGTITIPYGESMARATNEVLMSGLLDAESDVADTVTATISVYDSLGVPHQIDVEFEKTGDNDWDWSVSTDDSEIAVTGSGDIQFDDDGTFDPANDALTISMTCNNGAANATIDLNMSGVTQLEGTSSVTAASQNGLPTGSLTSFSVSDLGEIVGVYSNGLNQTLGQIALATFQNSGGLLKMGQSLYTPSANSGLAQVGLPGQDGRGEVSAGYLEMSNVELATEFTSMIIAQRGFQANSRVITASDEMLQELVNLKR
jgi:flagellar hook protein FlgE